MYWAFWFNRHWKPNLILCVSQACEIWGMYSWTPFHYAQGEGTAMFRKDHHTRLDRIPTDAQAGISNLQGIPWPATSTVASCMLSSHVNVWPSKASFNGPKIKLHDDESECMQNVWVPPTAQCAVGPSGWTSLCSRMMPSVFPGVLFLILVDTLGRLCTACVITWYEVQKQVSLGVTERSQHHFTSGCLWLEFLQLAWSGVPPLHACLLPTLTLRLTACHNPLQKYNLSVVPLQMFQW